MVGQDKDKCRHCKKQGGIGYRASLRPGDTALLGRLTEGGQGLVAANNCKYIAVRKSTKWAKHIQESRPEKSAEAIKAHRIPIDKIANFSNTADYLASLTEKEITTLFDELKELYGRDIFHFRAGVYLPPYLTTAKLLM